MDELRTTYNKIAKDWYRDHQKDDWWVEGVDEFCSYFYPQSTILDVGCGAGVKARYLSDRGMRVTGIDFANALLDIAKQEIPQVEFISMDMRNLAELNREFDGIFSQASLLHIPKKEVSSVLSGWIEKLKPGGYLYISVKEKRPEGPEEEFKTENDYGYEYSRFFSYFTLEELKKYLQDLNMEVVYENIFPVGETRWVQVISKK